LATWLLDRFGSSTYGESLAGDLIEQYQKERSRIWYWKQVIVAVLTTRAKFSRPPWMAAGRLLSGLLAEATVVLTVCVVADEMRRGHGLAQAMNQRFIGTLTVLMTAAAAFAFAASRRGSNRIRGRAAVNVLILAFGVIALGAGTLTWAASLRQDTCQSTGCVCPRE
jgi:hypothetical protein